MTKKRNKYSPVSKHRRFKTKLQTQLSQLDFNMIDWEKDLLPEHLWIDFLSQEYKKFNWNKMYNDFIDKLEQELDNDLVILGFISDFGIIPEKSRISFIKNNKEMIYKLFYKPIGKLLTLYPDNPANWLLLDEWRNKGNIDFEIELSKLSKSILRLLKAKNLYTGHLRAVPLNRLFAHNKLFFTKNMSVVDLLSKYPGECNEDEKYHVQSHARMVINMEYSTREHYKDRIWPKYFWRQNYNLSPCRPSEIKISSSSLISEKELENIYSMISGNCDLIVEYIDIVSTQYKYDLYETKKDEVLLGLFARLVRLIIVFFSDSNLWSRDLSGIIQRCIVDTAITFSHLSINGTNDEFENFIKYGEGKEKLLMLHLQNDFSDTNSLNDISFEQLESELGGGINPELIDIELAGWTKQSSRTLAYNCGFEKEYKLIYDPASSDIHGTWTSLKAANLNYCISPLHRFHKIPALYTPPLYINNINLVNDIYEKCYKIGVEHLGFPEMKKMIVKIQKENV